MSRPFDQAFARAFSHPRSVSKPAAPVDSQPLAKLETAPWDEANQIIIQVPEPDLSTVPSPHIAVSQTTTSTSSPKAPATGQPANPIAQPDALPQLTHESMIVVAAPVDADWLIASAGIELPAHGVATTLEAAPATSPPTDSDRDAPTTESTADLIEETPAPQVGSVESQENALPTVQPSETETEDDASTDDAMSALDIPLLLEQEMLESLHRAAESMRTTDTQLQQTAGQVQAFLPVWEIDRLHWPEVVTNLEAKLGSELQGAAEGIRVAIADGLKVLGFTSCSVLAGRTTTLLLLCRALRRLGVKVAIVDAANELATLAEQCGIDSPYGWNEAIVAGKSMEEAATLAVADQVTLIAWTPGATGTLARLPITSLSSQWNRLRQAFDIVLVELPTTEAGVVTALQHHRDLCDALVLVRSPSDEDQQLAEAVEALQQTMAGTVGIIENQHAHDQ